MFRRDAPIVHPAVAARHRPAAPFDWTRARGRRAADRPLRCGRAHGEVAGYPGRMNPQASGGPEAPSGWVR
jgi:hypothetical protein